LKKVLFVGEFTPLSTGYSVYWREVISRIHAMQKYEVAEMASYATPEDPRTYQQPWKVYPVVPPQNREDLQEKFRNDPSANFGGNIFEEVVLDFEATHILSLRDYWMDSFIDQSPYRRFYNWIHMPTVDAAQQNKKWLAMYKRADTLLTYTDWAKSILEQEGGLTVKSAASPAAPHFFEPNPDKKQAKQLLGINPDINVIGMVARNQRRKLFPDLCQAFRRYLDETGSSNTILYLHTSYPDMGWPLEKLILANNLSSLVYLTYICKCGNIFASPFVGGITPCGNCGGPASPSNVRNGVPSDFLCKIYQSMDLYCQIANSEGFGLPQSEAAACGIPIMTMDYAAMGDVLEKIRGLKITPSHLNHELDSGCLRASANVEEITEGFKRFFKLPAQVRAKMGFDTRKRYEQHYNYDTSANIWSECIDELDVVGGINTAAPQIYSIPQYQELQCSNSQYIRYVVTKVLKDTAYTNTYFEMELLANLNAGMVRQPGSPDIQPFDRQIAYNITANMANKRNIYENLRRKKYGL
jgi:glycosyltransferase involved in cell wall biosynthesis